MKAAKFSETSMKKYQNTRRYVSLNSNLHGHRHVEISSEYIVNFLVHFPLFTFAVLNFHISSHSPYIILMHILPHGFYGEDRGRVFFRIIAIHPLSLRHITEEDILNSISFRAFFIICRWWSQMSVCSIVDTWCGHVTSPLFLKYFRSWHRSVTLTINNIIK
jgi:hypothetical protein